MPLSGSRAPQCGINEAAARAGSCRSMILAEWAALGCDVWVTGDKIKCGPQDRELRDRAGKS